MTTASSKAHGPLQVDTKLVSSLSCHTPFVYHICLSSFISLYKFPLVSREPEKALVVGPIYRQAATSVFVTALAGNIEKFSLPKGEFCHNMPYVSGILVVSSCIYLL
ncbi:Uncharacterized protein Rs2_24713 [Raphanus sativus]|nr:Uncharacterized protein Rs2_24713 [Raphanus sativus]